MARTVPTTLRETEEREARGDALFSAGLAVLALAGLWYGAPAVQDTAFWRDHFADASIRGMLPFFGAFAVPGALARAVWPRTWESELLARALRRLAASVLLWWTFGTALEAPTFATALVAPVLAGPLLTASGLAVRHRLGVAAWTGIAVASVGLVLLLVLLVTVDTLWLWLAAIALPLAGYASGASIGLRRERRLDPAPVAAVLDLPLGTLAPPGGLWGLATTVALLLFTALVVAPGVPVRTLVLWTPFALAVPFLVRGVVRLGGVAHSKALAGPVEARRHTETIHHLPDEMLERLDEHMTRFARTGRGRRSLARLMSELLAPTVPHASEAWLYERLCGLPRGRRNRRKRIRAMHRMLAGGLADDDAAPRMIPVRTNGGRMR